MKFQAFSCKSLCLKLATETSEGLSALIFSVQQFSDPEDGGIVSSKNLILKSDIYNNKEFLCITHKVEHYYISPSSTVGIQLHVSALFVGHLQVVISLTKQLYKMYAVFF